MSDCCSSEKNSSKEMKLCPQCMEKGVAVGEKTVKSLVVEERLEDIEDFGQFYFCSTLQCEVVYFRGEERVILRDHLKIKVGVKEEDPHEQWLCYCFHYSKGSIRDEIRKNGHSSAIEDITAQIKAGNCSCEINNPKGKCCLGDVRKGLKEISEGLNV